MAGGGPLGIWFLMGIDSNGFFFLTLFFLAMCYIHFGQPAPCYTMTILTTTKQKRHFEKRQAKDAVYALLAYCIASTYHEP